MKIPYFPGCTLYNKARGLDNSTRASLAALGVELAELPQWTCCGTVFPLARDNYMGMVAAARILAGVAGEGEDRLLTVCSFCYNVLKRVNYEMQHNLEARQKLNDYLEENYGGEIQVVHPLEICKEDVGFNAIQAKTSRNLKGLKVACYYGCMLVRPALEMGFDDPENPTIMEEMVAALGAEVVEYPHKTTCCGSYQVLHENDLVRQRVRDILNSAVAKGAEAIITSCPLCQFNLDWLQEKILELNTGFRQIPVLYFTQLLGVALELPRESLGLEQHYVDPRPLLLGAMPPLR
ncbi:CoB--CoM heterodisulfide reductase iron-sulfur subunit B family protein [Desulfofundulus thermosubterraneus]|uniref:Heterodisulfide reductase subunit B n=1 Tax=Desulfofundulus thermosubterraneus DSM 16057 TaxID=1121432 RepID=A0A1M6G5B7_9FIRM|nr:CoB--CoM heterodisulfide reductase iron-sulfur subunit B family protein [Desulfofundulus thermosubterraneus]SHJ05135.1 heterodisulfide reductase subunit B [Desulfofundulus thermosubterraneus DSM 16057]